MRIVYLIDHLRPDGTQQFLRRLSAGLAARGHGQAVVCLNDSYDPALVSTLRGNGIEVRIIGQRALASGVGMVSLWLWLRARRFDVALTLLFYGDLIGRPLARAAGIARVISSLRSINFHYTGWQRLLIRRTAALVDLVVLNGSHVREFAIQEEGVAADRIRVILNGVEPVHGTAIRQHDNGLPRVSPLIGGVGRLSPEKGYDLLLAALAHATQRHAHLVLIGSGSDARLLQEQALRLSISDRVHFTGQRSDVAPLLPALDLFVHPARQEGMSNALLEAMIAGLPIIATAIPGNREALDSDTCGWLVPPDDPAALAAAIDAALSDPAEAARRGAAARRRAEQLYSIDAMLDAWEQVLSGR